ncbi:MAG: hypothetical protein EOO14_14550 [Chitinophagaceae bacterium]|nr:MAG: hypothetical protein EOO14_14550 [Chitinophagaceae bacterium]
MRNATSYWLKQIGCWILFLQLVNLSIDPPQVDAVFQTRSAQQAANSLTERESVFEYVSEELLAFDIPDTEEQEVEKSVQAFELYLSQSPSFSLLASELPLQHPGFYANRFSCWRSRPHAPPPKA